MKYEKENKEEGPDSTYLKLKSKIPRLNKRRLKIASFNKKNRLKIKKNGYK